MNDTADTRTTVLEDIVRGLCDCLNSAAGVLDDVNMHGTAEACRGTALDAERMMDAEELEVEHNDELPFGDLLENAETKTTTDYTIHLVPGTVLHISSLYDK